MVDQEMAMLRHRGVFTKIRRHPWVWRGLVRTHAGGQVYVIDIDAGVRPGDVVRIWCREPVLVPLGDTGRPPHTFGDGSLCVNNEPPSRFKFLAETVVPWIYSWLYFYERWLETGDWLGPQSPGHEVERASSEGPVKDEPSSEEQRPMDSAPSRKRGTAA
jgi:hypothetical protein